MFIDLHVVQVINLQYVYIQAEPEVINVFKEVLLCMETKNTVSKQFRL